jgi:hypothetical protein
MQSPKVQVSEGRGVLVGARQGAEGASFRLLRSCPHQRLEGDLQDRTRGSLWPLVMSRCTATPTLPTGRRGVQRYLCEGGSLEGALAKKLKSGIEAGPKKGVVNGGAARTPAYVLRNAPKAWWHHPCPP